ncbi:MAG: hypothetical protein ABIK85_03920, partial [Candidatus Eisenbacteria bacterium]
DSDRDLSSSMPSETDKRALATELYEMLALSEGPCWYFIEYGGSAVFCGEDVVSEVGAQIDKARSTGVIDSSPLASHAVQHVLDRERN